MADTPPRVHHVVFAVPNERMPAAVEFFTELGFNFASILVADAGLRVMLDWNQGLELVTPEPTGDADGGAVAEFLRRHGEGVYSVVLRVPEASVAEDIAVRYGATVRYRQHRDLAPFSLDEIDLEVMGLPLTLLSTDLPDEPMS